MNPEAITFDNITVLYRANFRVIKNLLNRFFLNEQESISITYSDFVLNALVVLYLLNELGSYYLSDFKSPYLLSLDIYTCLQVVFVELSNL